MTLREAEDITLATRLIEQARAEWLDANDPKDGTDVVTPYDVWFYQDRQPTHIRVGEAVRKPRGYPFPGEVRAAFLTKAGLLRYVVENRVAAGLLHIFAPEQIEVDVGRPVPEHGSGP